MQEIERINHDVALYGRPLIESLERLAEATDPVRRTLDLQLEVLKRYEWSDRKPFRPDIPDIYVRCCPVCHGALSQGHRKGCAISKALGNLSF